MKYTTIIKIVSEAKNKNEAIDIAGEFLSGNLDEGILMKCKTFPSNRTIFVRSTALCAIPLLLLSFAMMNRPVKKSVEFSERRQMLSSQAPLKAACSPSRIMSGCPDSAERQTKAGK